MKVIYNAKVVTPHKTLNNGYVIYTNKILEIGTLPLPNRQYTQKIDACNNYLIPGLIDIHCHGNLGADTMDSNKEALITIADYKSKHGVTSFLPTTMTDSLANIENALLNIRECQSLNTKSRILGAHLEGPFINTSKKGAQNQKYIIKPNQELVAKFKDVLKIITYAPEEDTDLAFTQFVNKELSGIVLSIGHTAASYELACEAMKFGARSASHLFNGMTTMHHRNPGIAIAVLEKDNYCEIIADNIHVHPAWYRILSKIKSLSRLILVSDSIKATGVSDGEYDFAGQVVVVKNKIARLKENKSLAGSTLTLNKAVLNFINHTNLELHQVINMASLNPASLLNINEKHGSIDVNKIADIVLCDEELNVLTTILAGETVYTTKNEGEINVFCNYSR